jgi:DNA polymerase
MSAARLLQVPETVQLADETDLAGWRRAARRLAVAGVQPGQVLWEVDGRPALFALNKERAEADPVGVTAAFVVPRGFLDLAETVIQHRDPERFALLYALLWRIRGGERDLLENAADPLVARVARMAKAVRREAHKMTAFVRFREIAAEDGPRFVAWFEPEHHVLEATAPFFVRRFTGMRWSILTPRRSAHWDGAELYFGPGARRSDAPGEDALEAAWKTYYASIFNPARLNPAKMRADMPRRYWRNLPEAALIPELAQHAGRRTAGMLADPPTAPAHAEWAPAPPSAPAAPRTTLDALRADAAACRRCPLWGAATQTVFGEGPADAEIMLVGEQPGDQEDLAGRPFVGPAGRLLDEALAAAGLDRRKLYVTNAVKHFKFEPRGKRRIHQKPERGEIQHCRWWLVEELRAVRPRLVVALGATAAETLLGRRLRVGEARGRVHAGLAGERVLVTVHPSYLLRIPDEATRAAERRAFIADLALATRVAAGG